MEAKQMCHCSISLQFSENDRSGLNTFRDYAKIDTRLWWHCETRVCDWRRITNHCRLDHIATADVGFHQLWICLLGRRCLLASRWHSKMAPCWQWVIGHPRRRWNISSVASLKHQLSPKSKNIFCRTLCQRRISTAYVLFCVRKSVASWDTDQSIEFWNKCAWPIISADLEWPRGSLALS